MKRRMAVVILALCICAGIVYAADDSAKTPSEDRNVGRETVNTITDTTQSVVKGTADVAKTSVRDTVAVPKTAIQAVKDTANTALNGADAAIKAITGEDAK